MGPVKRFWYLPPMRAAKVQASLRIRAVSPEPSLLAHTSSESRGTFRQKTRSLAPLNGWACAVEICHDGMLEDTNSLDGAQIEVLLNVSGSIIVIYQYLLLQNVKFFLRFSSCIQYFNKNISPLNLIDDGRFKIMLTNNMVSFEQLSPGNDYE